MIRVFKVAGTAGILLSAMCSSSLAQQPAPAAAPAGGGAQVGSASKSLVMQGTIKFLEESDVAALRDGVIRQIEFNVGDRIEEDEPIGYLHDEMAKLKLQRQKVVAESIGATQRAQAQLKLSLNELAIRENLRRKDPRLVTDEEMRSYQARVEAASADATAAAEEKKIAEAELGLAEREVEEHIIRAPFTGYVTNRMKDPGEAVQANEPVLRLGRTDKLRFFGYLPLANAVTVSIGDVVDVQPEIADGDLAIEKVTFRGKVAAIGREVTAVGRTEVQVIAEITNAQEDPNSPGIGTSLLAGLKGRMTIYTGSAGGAAVAALPDGSGTVSSTTLNGNIGNSR